MASDQVSMGQNALVQDGPAAEKDADDAAERALVSAACQGDRAAFASLYDRYLDRVYWHCYYRTGDRTDAEDIAQQTFLKAWRSISRFKSSGAPFVAWLLTICHHEAINHLRKTPPRQVLDCDHLADYDGDPEGATIDKLEWNAVRCSLARLKPDQQQVIVLRYVEDFSISEIASVMGKRENHVSVILHRALAELRKHLNAGSDTPGTKASFDGLNLQIGHLTRE